MSAPFALSRIHHLPYRCRAARETVEFYQRVGGMGFEWLHRESEA